MVLRNLRTHLLLSLLYFMPITICITCILNTRILCMYHMHYMHSKYKHSMYVNTCIMFACKCSSQLAVGYGISVFSVTRTILCIISYIDKAKSCSHTRTMHKLAKTPSLPCTQPCLCSCSQLFKQLATLLLIHCARSQSVSKSKVLRKCILNHWHVMSFLQRKELEERLLSRYTS